MLFNQMENLTKYILLNKLQKLSTLPNIRIILVKMHTANRFMSFLFSFGKAFYTNKYPITVDWWQPKWTAHLSHFAIVLYLDNFENFVLLYIFLIMKGCWRNLSLNDSPKSDQREFFKNFFLVESATFLHTFIYSILPKLKNKKTVDPLLYPHAIN